VKLHDDRAREILQEQEAPPTGPLRVLWRGHRIGWYRHCLFMHRQVLGARRDQVKWRGLAWGPDEPIVDRQIRTVDEVDQAIREVVAQVPWLTEGDLGQHLSISIADDSFYVAAAFRRVKIRAAALYLSPAARAHVDQLAARYSEPVA
ncbi:MAG: hypothetical protein AB7U83_23260, partial [Vicinamibacterales bacterium]